jgi:hypothetical protein
MPGFYRLRSVSIPCLLLCLCAVSLWAPRAQAVSWGPNENTSAENRIATFSGEARNSKGQLIYREENTMVIEKHLVKTIDSKYFSDDGKQIGEMVSDLTKNPYLPDYTYKNFRNQVENGLTLDMDKGEVFLFRKRTGENEFSREKLKYSKDMVGGMGILFFIMDHVAELSTNEKLPVQLLVPAKLDQYDYRIYSPPSREQEIGKLSLKLDVSNWFLRLFSSDIKIVYDRTLQKITSYRGTTWVTDENGKSQNVEVKYP